MFAHIQKCGQSSVSEELQHAVDAIAQAGGTPLVVTRNGKALGVIHLKDIVKGGIKERFAHCAGWGSRP